MAVNPVEISPPGRIGRRKAPNGMAEASAHGSPFAETLRAAAENGSRSGADSIPAAVAAEMLRLKMMKSALSLADTSAGTSPAAGSPPVELLLASFPIAAPPPPQFEAFAPPN